MKKLVLANRIIHNKNVWVL